MSTKCQNIFLSESSIAYQRLAEAHTEQVGKANPIDLPLINVVKINDTFGEKITNGNIATIYKVNGCSSPRVYKAIPQDRFANGDEIRISKTASDIGVAPTFYSAFLVEQSSTNFVVIEMDDGGKSLGKLMEDLAENSEVQEEEEVVVEAHPLTEKEKAFQAMLKKIRAEVASKYSTVEVTEIPQKKRLPLEEAIDKLYPKREQFYNELFKKIKVLAEHNISWVIATWVISCLIETPIKAYN